MTATPPSTAPAIVKPLRTEPTLPDWYPAWARELAELYYTGTINTFVLHGNVHDLILSRDEQGTESFISLPDFLSQQVFGSWDVLLGYDLGRGLRALAGGNAQRLQGMMQYVSGIIGNPTTWTREPDKVFDLLDQLVQRGLLSDEGSARKRMAFIFEHAQYLLPTGDLAALARNQASRLVRMISWAANPYIKRLNIAYCLLTEKLSELSDRLVNNPHVCSIAVPLPDSDERRRYTQKNWRGISEVRSAAGDGKKETKSAAGPATAPAGMNTISLEGVTQNSAGLSLMNLNVLLSQSSEKGIEPATFRRLKKNMIERQCQGLVEFVEPPHTLDLIVGQPEAKARLQQDADWISQGRLETAPMGYLFCGAVGTGKTFFAECYAGSIGIPCVKLRNFRSKYVGETEGNIEQVLTVLRSLGPVVVIVDEADASLGDRRADGDSGTSGRVFSMIAQQMGDTRYRGRIIWMLLTCRPDLLPIDLKRQGRCEVHIPLFSPTTTDEIVAMFRAMSKKNKIQLTEGAIPEISPDRQMSGADLESILLASRRKALVAGREVVERVDFESAAEEFIPSAEGLEKEMQELAAVLECTDRNFLPRKWQEKIAAPDARARLQERMMALRQLVDE